MPYFSPRTMPEVLTTSNSGDRQTVLNLHRSWIRGMVVCEYNHCNACILKHGYLQNFGQFLEKYPRLSPFQLKKCLEKDFNGKFFKNSPKY